MLQKLKRVTTLPCKTFATFLPTVAKLASLFAPPGTLNLKAAMRCGRIE